MAAGTIQQIITLKGQDEATSTVNSVKKSLKDLGSASEQVAEKAGDAERGFRGVKDIVGDIAGKDAQRLLDVFGGVESVLKGFGPALGPIGLGLAAAGAAAVYLYEKAEEARKAVIDARIQELEAAKETRDQTAAILNINSEILGVKYQRLTVEQQEAENARIASKLLDNEIKQQEAIRDEQTEQLATLRQQNAQYRSLLAQGAALLAQAKLIADRQAAGQAVVVRQTTERLEQEAAVNLILNDRDRLNARAALRAERLAEVNQKLSAIENGRRLNGQQELKAEQDRQELVRQRIALQTEELADAKAGDALRSKGGGGGGKSRAQREAEEAKKLREEERKQREQQQKETLESVTAFLQAEEQALQELTQARIAAAKGEERAQLAKNEILRKAEIERAVLSESLAISEEARRNKLAALEIQMANQIAAIDKQVADERLKQQQELDAAKEKAAKDEADRIEKLKQQNKELADAQRATWESVNNIVGPAVAAFTGEGGIGGALAEVVKQSSALAAQWKGEGVGADAIIGSVGAVASAVVEGEKEKAAILALTSAAQAAVFYATGQIPQAVAATAAAALYGAAAGGLIGGGTPAATGGGGFAAAPAVGGGGGFGGGGAGGGTTTVINFNAPLGTPYEIGKSVAKAQKAASAGGWSPRMAMGV